MSAAGWHVTLRKERSIWHYTTHNPHGGSFGSTADSGHPMTAAWVKAVRGIPRDAYYTLTVNGRDKGGVIRGTEPWATGPWADRVARLTLDQWRTGPKTLARLITLADHYAFQYRLDPVALVADVRALMFDGEEGA